jgi:hypothetical protein
MKKQLYQKHPHHLQLSVLKTQRLRLQKPLQHQNYHQLNIPIKMLLLETQLLMLSLLEMSESVPKPLEPHQYTFQPQHSHLKHLMFLKQLDLLKKSQLPPPPQPPLLLQLRLPQLLQLIKPLLLQLPQPPQPPQLLQLRPLKPLQPIKLPMKIKPK